MYKIVMIVLIFTTMATAQLRDVKANEGFLKSNILVVDIRTAPEWKETGVVKDSVLITFFDEQGNYDAHAFLESLNEHVSKEKEFAIICRTGNRTTALGKFLSQQGYRVINLQGGIKHLISQGYKPEFRNVNNTK